MTETDVLNSETSSYKTNEKEADKLESHSIELIAIIILLAEQFLSIVGGTKLTKPATIKKKVAVLMSIPGMKAKEANLIARDCKTPLDVIEYITSVQLSKIKEETLEHVYERLVKVAMKNVSDKGKYLRFNGMSRGDSKIYRSQLEEIVLAPHLGENENGANFIDLLDKHFDDVEKSVLEMLSSYSKDSKERFVFKFRSESIAKKINYHVRTILRNETSRIIGETNALIYEQYGIEYYIYRAELDYKTTDTCLSLNQNIFKLAERQVGVNASPMHINCRGTELPVL